MFRDSILLITNTVDLLSILATANVNGDGLVGIDEHITHALVFDVPCNVESFAVPYTMTEGVLEGDRRTRLKYNQCFVGCYEGIAGVEEHKQSYPYRVIELRKVHKPTVIAVDAPTPPVKDN